MGKPAEIEPRWLVSMMCRWARYELTCQSRALGYPKKAAGFSEKTTGGHDHSDPTAFTAQDFRTLETALDDCREREVNLWAAMMMYYKPWAVASFEAEGFPFANSTYYDRLHRAHRLVAANFFDPVQLSA